MAEILDMQSWRDGPPDAEHVARVAREGKLETWFEFTCSYVAADGSEYGFTIWAMNHAHAERLLADLRQTAKVRGQLYATVAL